MSETHLAGVEHVSVQPESLVGDDEDGVGRLATIGIHETTCQLKMSNLTH